MQIFATLLIICLEVSFFKSDEQLRVGVYCRNRDRLITSDELDEYLLIDVDVNMTLRLDCHFCNELNDGQPKVWYYQDRNQLEMEKEVLLGMNNNMSINRIHMNPEFSLIIRDFELQDAGIYRCRGPHGQDMDEKLNYRLERMSKYFIIIFVIK